MKYVDEFRDPELITNLAHEIARIADPDRHYRIMEVCGGHTHSIYRHGLKDVLPKNIQLGARTGLSGVRPTDGAHRRRALRARAARARSSPRSAT